MNCASTYDSRPAKTPRAAGAFTLLEVMVALLLALAIPCILKLVSYRER